MATLINVSNSERMATLNALVQERLKPFFLGGGEEETSHSAHFIITSLPIVLLIWSEIKTHIA